MSECKCEISISNPSDKDRYILILTDKSQKAEAELAEAKRTYPDKWFKKGQESIKRKNQSGCVCVVNDDGAVESICAAHSDWRDAELAEAKPFVDAVKSLHNGYINPEMFIEPKTPRAAIKQLIGEAESLGLAESKLWKQELAELRELFLTAKAFIDSHVCDYDITAEMCEAWDKYQQALRGQGGMVETYRCYKCGAIFRTYVGWVQHKC